MHWRLSRQSQHCHISMYKISLQALANKGKFLSNPFKWDKLVQRQGNFPPCTLLAAGASPRLCGRDASKKSTEVIRDKSVCV